MKRVLITTTPGRARTPHEDLARQLDRVYRRTIDQPTKVRRDFYRNAARMAAARRRDRPWSARLSRIVRAVVSGELVIRFPRLLPLYASPDHAEQLPPFVRAMKAFKFECEEFGYSLHRVDLAGGIDQAAP